MTLQEKMLAKQSKKGFTLVELVVVIAILAILAAIAIPAVVSIISSATVSQGQSDASTLNNAVKEFYAGVYSGSINQTSAKDVLKAGAKGITANTNDYSKLPPAGASATVKQKVAGACTIQMAQAYSGIAVPTDDMRYCTTAVDSITVGTIMYKDDPLVTANGGAANEGAKKFTKLTDTTTMKALYALPGADSDYALYTTSKT